MEEALEEAVHEEDKDKIREIRSELGMPEIHRVWYVVALDFVVAKPVVSRINLRGAKEKIEEADDELDEVEDELGEAQERYDAIEIATIGSICDLNTEPRAPCGLFNDFRDNRVELYQMEPELDNAAIELSREIDLMCASDNKVEEYYASVFCDLWNLHTSY